LAVVYLPNIVRRAVSVQPVTANTPLVAQFDLVGVGAAKAVNSGAELVTVVSRRVAAPRAVRY
jgi:hypothetical protein